MKQLLVAIVTAIIIAGIIPLKSATAVGEVPNLTIRCLNATNISANKNQHFVELDGSGFEPNKPIEVWRDTKEGFVCAIDMNGESLCGSGAASAKDNGREFQLLTMTKDQVVTDNSGKIHIGKTRSRTDERLTHNFYGAQKTAATVTGGTIPELTAEEYGLKLLTFIQEQQTASPSGANNCTTVFFDPYGRIFDSVSLEPIINASVYLLDSDKSRLPNQPGIINPNVTKADGAFSFFVDNGTYYLDPIVPANYSYPLPPAEIQALSASQTIYTDLYTGGAIVQANGIPEHRDIPLKPLDPLTAANTTPVIYPEPPTILAVNINGIDSQKISGFVSHPLSTVRVYSGTREVASLVTDNLGTFEIVVPNSDIDQSLPLEIRAEKAVSTTPTPIAKTWQQIWTKMVQPVWAQVSNVSPTVSVYPKPNYLIGFLYSTNRRVLPMSRVEIILPKMNNQLYATVKADENGFVFIPHQSLPPVDYRLRIKDPAGNVAADQTVEEFISNNQGFLTKEKVNLLDQQTEEVAKVAEKVRVGGNRYLSSFITTTPTPLPTPPQKSDASTYIVLTMLVLIAVIVLIVVLTKFRSRYSNGGL